MRTDLLSGRRGRSNPLLAIFSRAVIAFVSEPGELVVDGERSGWIWPRAADRHDTVTFHKHHDHARRLAGGSG